ncbi:MAG TPA: hypothetical protein VLF61_03435, partial [Rhabdochlamydiaceae bacterium]|nr:hypothetical protein [Rhabdochlamydiaceae bacterium]
THYRYRGQNDLAYLFAHHASFIEPKQEWMSFISDSLKYEINEEISIAAYYTPFREEGFFAADQILLQKNAPWNQKEQAFKNLLFYIQNLKNAEFKKVEIDLPLIREGEEAYYNPMNPSIYRTDQGYKLICRAVNFTLKNGVYTSLDPEDGVIRTRNFLIHYDQDFKLLSQNEIVETAPRMKVEPLWRIEGFEDCRLFAFDQGDWFTCTTFDTNPTGVCQISLCKLENEPKGKQIQVEKLVALKGPDSNRYEKNWLPFVKENQLLMLYSYMPFIINKPNIETGEWEPVLQYELNFDFSRFRGSAGPIPFDRGYLVLIHEVFMRTENERCYLHRFIYLDQDFMIKKISLPFTFQHVGVEYCCSMTLDHTGTKLIMPIGIEDREAYLCTIDLDTVRALLQDL